MAKSDSRTLAKLFGVFHNVSYYAKELRVFQDRGIEEFWHGYLAFRSAPMGAVDAQVVTSTFYNFAPGLVEAAIPAAWEVLTPAEAIALRLEAIGSCLDGAFAEHDVDADAVAAAEVVFDAMTPLSSSGRALFGAYRALPPPETPLLRLWHAATLWREYRGDGHNIALAYEGIDGIECHVLLAGRGIASQEIIQKIRGWDQASWNDAHGRLLARGLVDEQGTLSEDGASLRRHIEDMTDRLAAAPLESIGATGAATLIEQLSPMVSVLTESGVVPGRWPPPEGRIKSARM